MRGRNFHIQVLVGTFIIAAPLAGGVKLQVRDGRPILDGVYVNGHGPYRFLLDTGANVNLIETRLARVIGLPSTFRTEFASLMNNAAASGSDGIEMCLDSVCAGGQEFLYSDLGAIRRRWPDVQGVAGQWFLARFDYTLDMRGKMFEFGRQKKKGTRTPFRWLNGRAAISTSLGDLVLDSGAETLVLLGSRPDQRRIPGEIRSITGKVETGAVFGQSLIIEGRKFWSGNAVVIPAGAQPGVEGLLPVGFFKSIYICNSEGYLVLE
jgi:hypothetical protein